MEEMDRLGERLGRALAERELTIAVAESLTGGALSAAIARVEGSGGWYRGAIVAYSSAVKHDLLDVPTEKVVSEPAARAMAETAATRLGADLTVAVTGVAGPDEQDGEPPGTVWMATHRDGRTETMRLHLPGSPEEIVEETCAAAIGRLADLVESTAES
jgi:nicotinamide-nucleotide amidase